MTTTARAFADQLAKDFDGALGAFIELCTPEPDVEHIRRWLGHILRRVEPEAAVALIESYGIDLKPSSGGSSADRGSWAP